MMNVENDPSEGGVPPRPPVQKDNLEIKNLRPEELKMYKDCISSMYYKAGLPFALFCHLLSRKVKPEAEPLPRFYFKRGVLFLGNVLLGSLMFSPICFLKLRNMRRAADRREREIGLEQPSFVMEARSGPQPAEDFTYHSDLTSNLSQPETNFSSDFNPPPGLLLDDARDEKDLRVPNTTYEELRARHRSRYGQPTGRPSSLSLSEPILSTPTSSTDRPKSSEDESSASRPRKAVRNKYGDEIE